MGSVWAFRPATKQEMKYAFSCEEGDRDCKCIGHLRADFGRSGNEFWSTWWDHNADLKTQAFRDTLDACINRLRRKDVELAPLKSRSAMSKVCHDYPEAQRERMHFDYIFRVDAIAGGEYSFIMRMNPTLGFYNLYCYCYRTEDLEGGLA